MPLILTAGRCPAALRPPRRPCSTVPSCLRAPPAGPLGASACHDRRMPWTAESHSEAVAKELFAARSPTATPA
eukprot:2250263-Lingulodinium_polyedra.AAC.1